MAPFRDSPTYWERRYSHGGDSGAGSYGALAQYKADFLNNFVETQKVRSVIEFGCGDGNQLSLARYPRYIGLDPSSSAIERCMAQFRDDTTKSFFLYSTMHYLDQTHTFSAELGLSLDVLFHLVEDDIFFTYLSHLFASSRRFVIIYSSNASKPDRARHVRHREFALSVRETMPAWRLAFHEANPHNGMRGAVSEFFVYAHDQARSP